jgi:hypothetical protein
MQQEDGWTKRRNTRHSSCQEATVRSGRGDSVLPSTVGFKRIVKFCLWLLPVLWLMGCGGGNLANLTGGSGVDFSLSVSPGSQAVTAGQAINFLVTINPQSSPAPVVQLSVSGAPAGTLTQFIDGSLTAGGTVSLSIITSSATPTGTSQLTISGSDLSGSQKATVMLTVNPPPPPPDFNLTATPGSQNALVGGSASYALNVTANGSPTVNLSVSNLPAGVTADLSQNSITGTGNVTMTLSTTASTAINSYTVNVTGSDASGTETIQVVLVVVATDFSLSSSINSIAVTAGATLTGTLTVSPVVGTPGTVNLSLLSPPPSGITVNLSSSAIAGGNGTATITIAINLSVAPNNYEIDIQGADSSGTQTASIVLAVGATNPTAGFFISVTPPDNAVTAGETTTYTLNVLPNSGPVPSVTVSVGGLPDGASSVVSQGSTPGTFIITITTDSTESTTQSDFTITVTGPGGSQSLTVELDVNQPPCC